MTIAALYNRNPDVPTPELKCDAGTEFLKSSFAISLETLDVPRDPLPLLLRPCSAFL